MKRRKEKKYFATIEKHHKKMYEFKPYECWGLGTHVIRFIYPRLKYFATQMKLHGMPIHYGTHENPGLTNDECFEKWETDLKKMLFAFEYMMKITHDDYTCFEKDSEDQKMWIDYLNKTGPVYEGLKLFFENITDLWD